MKYTFNTKALKKAGFTLPEAFVFLLLRREIDPNKVIQLLLEKDMVRKDLDDTYSVNAAWGDNLDAALLSQDKELPSESTLEKLAKKLRDIFPGGKKPGTNVFFKSNTRDTVLRLQKFFSLYGKFSEEDILDAAQRYVDSFNGDYSYCRVLKYFIYKNENGETVSDLANFLENVDTESVNEDLWETYIN